MATRSDRVGELIEGIRRNRRVLVSPEGVELDIQIAGNGERLTAFAIDIFFMFLAIFALYMVAILVFFSHTSLSVGMTLILFVAFIVRNLYFLHFELAWQGQTPGKKICGLRVINRAGGELAASAVIARNLTREVEFFLPFSLYFSLGSSGGGALQNLVLFGWIAAIGALPLFNREHLRTGDLIAGTQVIVMPKRVLRADLAALPQEQGGAAATGNYMFSHEQLAIYGAFELQVLEELLRRPPGSETDRLLEEVCGKICRKIGWAEQVPQGETRRFLTDFYAAERANLERGQLFGRRKEDKNDK